MVDFRELLTSFVIIGLCVFSIMAFVITTQSQNNVSDPVVNVEVIGSAYSSLNESLRDQQSNSESALELFQSENPLVVFGSIIFYSVISSGKLFTGTIVGIFNILIKLPIVLLGVDPAVASAIILILIATIVIGLWRLYKVGG